VIDQDWLKRHEKGWVLHFNNSPVVKLNFMYSSQPVHYIKIYFLAPTAEAKSVLIKISDHLRDEETTTFLFNEGQGEKIKDLDFILTWQDDDRAVTIKDISETLSTKM